MGYTFYYSTVLLILFIDTIKSIQSVYKDLKVKMTKQLLVKIEWQLRQLSFILFSGLEEKF